MCGSVGVIKQPNSVAELSQLAPDVKPEQCAAVIQQTRPTPLRHLWSDPTEPDRTSTHQLEQSGAPIEGFERLQVSEKGGRFSFFDSVFL